MEVTDKKALVKAHLRLWLVLFGGGLALGHWFLEPMTEPVAVRWLYPKVAPSAQSHIVRFVDLQPLYERDATEATEGRLPAESFQEFLDAVRKLDKEHRPSAIGFDIPLFPNALTGPGNFIQQPPDREELLKTFMAFTDETDIPIRMGTPQFGLDVPGLQHDFPHLSRFVASTLIYRQGEIAPLWFGDDDKDNILGVLGFEVARDYDIKVNRYTLKRSAMEVQHYVEAPKDWPVGMKATKWVYVDYSLLRQREELTAHVTAEETVSKPPSVSFTTENLKRLEHHDNLKTLWIVGVTEVPEAQDTFVYDEHSQWLGEGEPIRGIYKHGAIANTYLNSPLKHVSLGEATMIDAAISLSGLMAVLLLEGLLNNKVLKCWGWLVLALPYCVVKLIELILRLVIKLANTRVIHWIHKSALKVMHSSQSLVNRMRKQTVSEQEAQDALLKQGAEHGAHHGKGNADEGAIRIGISVIVFVLAFVVSWILAAWLHNFWFGFVGSATYALVEPMTAHILHHHS